MEEEAKTYFAQGRFDLAYDVYTKVLFQADENELVKLLLNRALCALKVHRYESCLQDCELVLKQDPLNCKALLRKALALEGLYKFEEAISVVRNVLELITQNEVRLYAIQLLERLKRLHSADESAKAKEKQPVSFVTPFHSLRVCFSSPLPRFVRRESPLEISLFLANELGLWSESFTPILNAEDCFRIIPSLKLLHSWDGDTQEDLEAASIYSPQISSGGNIDKHGRTTIRISLIEAEDLNHRNLKSEISLVMLEFACSAKDVTSAFSLPFCLLPSADSSPISSSSSSSISSILVPDILPIPLELRNAISIGDAVHPQCIRKLPYFHSYVFECPGFISIGGKVWDATYILLHYLQRNPELVHGRRIVELGCGTGAAGISLSSLQPAHVTLTDTAELMPLVEANLSFNRYLGTHEMRYQLECFRAQAYNWTCDSAVVSSLLPCDLILASDVVYDAECFQALLQAIHDMLETASSSRVFSVEELSTTTGCDERSPERIMLLVYRKRNEDEEAEFFNLLYAQTNLQVSLIEQGEEENAGDILILKLSARHDY